MSFYVIRSTPFKGVGHYFCGLRDGEEEVWSSRQGKALRFRKGDKGMAELAAMGLSESRVVLVRSTPSTSTAEKK